MHRARRVFLILFPVLELTGLPSKQFSLKKKFFLFIYYFWLHGVFVAVSGLSLGAVSGGSSSCSAWAIH